MNKTIADEKIIAALLNTDTKKAAAKALGIKIDTLNNRMQSDSFRTKYKEAKDSLLSEAVTSLQKRMTAAIDTLFEVMQNPDTASQVKINAADTILRYSVKLTETEEIITRIEELENMSYERN